jgi:hypothetical protein
MENRRVGADAIRGQSRWCKLKPQRVEGKVTLMALARQRFARVGKGWQEARGRGAGGEEAAAIGTNRSEVSPDLRLAELSLTQWTAREVLFTSPCGGVVCANSTKKPNNPKPHATSVALVHYVIPVPAPFPRLRASSC